MRNILLLSCAGLLYIGGLLLIITAPYSGAPAELAWLALLFFCGALWMTFSSYGGGHVQ